MLPPSGQTIPWDQLPDVEPGNVFFKEWNTYKREMPRLLEEGHEGKVVLIKGDELIEIFLTWDFAKAEGYRRYYPDSFFIHTIQRQEPIYRIRGISMPWRS